MSNIHERYQGDHVCEYYMSYIHKGLSGLSSVIISMSSYRRIYNRKISQKEATNNPE